MNLASARFNMVEQQIRTWDVFDAAVLDLMATLPREQFVPIAFAELAFADFPIAIGHGEHMFCPKQEARALQALDLSGDEKVLEIGTGSGFLTAALASLASQVTSVERHQDFITHADSCFTKLGITNIKSEILEVTERWQPSERYDAIVVTASAPEPPKNLLEALKPMGKMFCIIQSSVDYAYLIQKSGDQLQYVRLFEMTTQPLKNFEKRREFCF